MPCSMHEYDAAKVAISQNERIHSAHQSSGIYTSVHLASPISGRDALSMSQDISAPVAPPTRAGNAQAVFSSTHETVQPCRPRLALDRYNGRAGNKRACEDLCLPDAFGLKRRQCLMPGFGAVERHAATKGFNGRIAQKAGLIMQEHSRSFVDTHLQHVRMPLHGANMLEVGLHRHPQSKLMSNGTNKDPLVEQELINGTVNRGEHCRQLHACHSSTEYSEGRISGVPLVLSTGPVEKKALAFQDKDHVSTLSQAQLGKRSPCQAQVGKQSSQNFSKPNSKVLVDVTNKFQVTSTPDAKKHMEEEDIHRLSQRHKQIEFGKNTLGYEGYLEVVPKSKRKGKDPRTPNPKQLCSKRSWDGQIRKWRRLLHDYDPPAEDGEELAEDMTLLKANQRNDKPEPAKDNIDPKTLLTGAQEIILASKDDRLSIYDDWMDS